MGLLDLGLLAHELVELLVGLDHLAHALAALDALDLLVAEAARGQVHAGALAHRARLQHEVLATLQADEVQEAAQIVAKARQHLLTLTLLAQLLGLQPRLALRHVHERVVLQPTQVEVLRALGVEQATRRTRQAQLVRARVQKAMQSNNNSSDMKGKKGYEDKRMKTKV